MALLRKGFTIEFNGKICNEMVVNNEIPWSLNFRANTQSTNRLLPDHQDLAGYSNRNKSEKYDPKRKSTQLYVLKMLCRNWRA